MKILVANYSLENVGGSETFTFTLIEELKKREFDVEYFTFKKGLVSNRIESELKINFLSKKKYDLILANHNVCVEKLYKKGFIIQTCHGIYPKLEQPSEKANAFVSISQEVQDHLAYLGFPSILIHNGINLKKYKSTKPINSEVKTILSLCHSENANKFIEKVCKKLEINFLKAFKYKDPKWNIEEIINKADIVVGIGRSSYEAMACGRPVIIYDDRRYFPSCGDGYIRNSLGLSLKNNCSGRYFNKKYDEFELIKDIKKYNALDGGFFRKFAEKELDMKINVDKYLMYFETTKVLKKQNRLKKVKKFIIRIGNLLFGKKK